MIGGCGAAHRLYAVRSDMVFTGLDGDEWHRHEHSADGHPRSLWIAVWSNCGRSEPSSTALVPSVDAVDNPVDGLWTAVDSTCRRPHSRWIALWTHCGRRHAPESCPRPSTAEGGLILRPWTGYAPVDDLSTLWTTLPHLNSSRLARRPLRPTHDIHTIHSPYDYLLRYLCLCNKNMEKRR